MQLGHDRLQPAPTTGTDPPDCSSCLCNWATIACKLGTSALESGRMVARWCSCCAVHRASKMAQLVLGFLHAPDFGLSPFVDLGYPFPGPFDESLPLPNLGGDRHFLCLFLGTLEGRSQALHLHARSRPSPTWRPENGLPAILVSGSILTRRLDCSFAGFRAVSSPTFVAQSSGPNAANTLSKLRTLAGDRSPPFVLFQRRWVVCGSGLLLRPLRPCRCWWARTSQNLDPTGTDRGSPSTSRHHFSLLPWLENAQHRNKTQKEACFDASRNCLEMSVTPVPTRQNSNERRSASMVFESATLCSCRSSLRLQPREPHIQMTTALQASSACHSNAAVRTKEYVYLWCTNCEQSLDLFRLTDRCSGCDVLSFARRLSDHKLCASVGTDECFVQQDHAGGN